MSGYQVDLSDIDQVVALVKSAGIKSVSAVASEVKTPGVWVNPTGWSIDKLAGYQLQTTLYLVVADQDVTRSRVALITLLNKVLTKVKPSGLVVPRTVILPHSPAPLPGLAVPFNVNCTS